MATETLKARIGYAQARKCIERILAAHLERHGEVPGFVVLVGGTAMAAHGLRELSEDVDFYAQDFDGGIVEEVERDMREDYGPEFKIDVTAGENLWGPIIFRDIAGSAEAEAIVVGGREVKVRKLSVEDLTMVKLVAGRPKDAPDLRILGPVTDADALIDRFNVVIRWHGDRGSQPAFADALVDFVERYHGRDAKDVVDRLAVPGYVKEMLLASRGFDDADDLAP